MSDLETGLAEITAKRPAYTLAAKMFEGEAKEVMAGGEIARQLGPSADRYRVNLAGKPVNAITKRLAINAVRVVSENGDENDALTKKIVDDIWEPNDLGLELPDFIEKVCEYGDAYILVWPSAGADLSAAEPPVASAVDVFIHGPENVRAIYSDENPRVIDYVVRTWQRSTDDRQRTDLYYADRIESFVSINPVTSDRPATKDADFETYRPAAEEDNVVRTSDGHLVNPWGRVPWFHGRTKRPYGRPVHKDGFGPQNIITKIVAVHAAVVDWQGWPYRAALSRPGTTGANQAAGLSDWNSSRPGEGRPSPSSSAFRRTPRPGDIDKWHDTDALVQLEPPSSANFLDSIRMYASLLSVVTDTPIDLNPSGQVESGESRRARLSDLLAKVEKLSAELGKTIAAVHQFALQLLGDGDDLVVSVEWKPVEKISDTEGWQAVQAKISAGVDRETALTEAGYLLTEVEKWGEPFADRVAALDQLADAMQKLGAALQYDLADEATVRDFVMRLLGDAEENEPEDASA